MQSSIERHAGIAATIPEGYRTDHFEQRMTFIESSASRSPMVIELWLKDGLETDTSASNVRTLAGHEVRYVEDERDGGSGGPQHVLRAWRAAGQRTLVMEAKVQRELGRPSFDVAWQVFASATTAL